MAKRPKQQKVPGMQHPETQRQLLHGVELTLKGVPIKVHDHPEGKILTVGPFVLELVLPLDTDTADAIAGDLTSGPSKVVRASPGDLARLGLPPVS